MRRSVMRPASKARPMRTLGRRYARARASSPRLLSLALVCPALLWLATLGAQAGTLEFFESSAGPGASRAIASPANDVLLDLEYGPASGEGGGIYGFSEVRIAATGNLTLSATGFWCAVSGCLHFPLPFVDGTEIVVTGGDDLLGEVATSLDLMSISVSGTNGYIVVVTGEYLDSTGPSSEPGAIQAVDPTVLASVPEPALATSLCVGGLTLAALTRRRARLRRGR